MLISNLQSKILSQQDDITLMPGHGPPSSIAAEKEFNLDLGYPILRETAVKSLRFPDRPITD